MWNEVVYQPGEIKVVAYNDNNEAVAQQVIKTAGEASTLKLTADRSTIHSGGKDLSFVTVEVLDKDGNVCPRAGNLLFFDVKGTGKLKALCNGDPTDQTSFGSNYMRAFNGKIVAVIESDDNAGEIVLRVSGGLLKSQSVNISVK
jgi:beta-galactosidase